VGVTGIYKILKNNNKSNPIDKIICIVNGIFCGISEGCKAENSNTMSGRLA
jgi:hypothetical protein